MAGHNPLLHFSLLPEDHLVNALSMLGHSLNQFDNQARSVMPMLSGPLIGGYCATEHLRDILQGDRATAFQKRQGPVAMTLRRIAHANKVEARSRAIARGESVYASEDVETRIRSLTPRQANDKGVEPLTSVSLAHLLIPYIPFATLGIVNLIPYVEGVPTTTWREMEEQQKKNLSEDPRDLGEDSLSWDPVNRRYYAELHFRDPNGSCRVLWLTFSSTHMAMNQSRIYDALEDVVYGGSQEFFEVDEVSAALCHLFKKYGWSPEDYAQRGVQAKNWTNDLAEHLRQHPTPLAVGERPIDSYSQGSSYYEERVVSDSEDPTQTRIEWKMHIDFSYETLFHTNVYLNVEGVDAEPPRLTGERTKDKLTIASHPYLLEKLIALRLRFLETTAERRARDRLGEDDD